MTSSVHPSSSSSFTVRELCLAAVMAAVVFLATFVPRIPIPLGYAHLGDAAIFLMVLFLGRRETLIAACFGSALSDLLGGFPLWIVPTLIIKYFMADIAWRVIRPDQKRASLARLVVGLDARLRRGLRARKRHAQLVDGLVGFRHQGLVLALDLAEL